MQESNVYPPIQHRRPLRLRGLLLLLSGVVAFLLFAAPVAMADDPIGDAAGAATDTVNDAAGSATDTVNDAAGSATDTVNDAAGAATDTVNDAAGAATDTVNDAAGSATDTVNDAAGSATNSVGADQTSQTGNQAGDALTLNGGTASSPLRSTPLPEGARSSLELDRDSTAPDLSSPESTPSVESGTPSELSAPLAHDDPDPQTDPCDEDPSLVCLGLLYGLGEATDTAAEVLGAVVRTGADVIVLAAIALLLGILGTAALAASRHSFSFAPGRAR